MCSELGPCQYLHLWDVAQSSYGTGDWDTELQFLTPEAKEISAHSSPTQAATIIPETTLPPP